MYRLFFVLVGLIALSAFIADFGQRIALIGACGLVLISVFVLSRHELVADWLTVLRNSLLSDVDQPDSAHSPTSDPTTTDRFPTAE